MNKNVTIVDMFGNPKGEMEKIEAHQKGVLHHAFSLFIIKDGKMLLQKRAKNKYHSGGLWSNACCSHPQLNENIFSNIAKKAYNELGIKISNLTHEFAFVYRNKFDNNLIEFEYDDVFTATTNSNIKLNYEEAENYCWISLKSLLKAIENKSHIFTYWFIICAPKIIQKYIK